MELGELRAVVTGGGSGMGREFCLRLAEAGASVALCDLNDAGMKQTLELAKPLRGKLVAIRANVALEDDVAKLMDEAQRQLGPLNALINNAGIFRDGLTVKRDRRTGEIRKMSLENWRAVIDVDLTGVFHTLHAALPVLRAQRSGVILTVSSIGADSCMPNGAPYVAAKSAVNALTVSVARENAHLGVRANVIAPGFIATDMGQALLEAHGEVIVKGIPLGRAGTPADVGGLAVYLASDEASWVTGHVFRIDGGALGGLH